LNPFTIQFKSHSLILQSITKIFMMAPSTAPPDLVPEPVSKLPQRPREDGSALTEHERSEIAFVDRYSAPDVYINEKNDTLWFPWIGPIELKPMRMENRTGTFVVGLRSKVAASLGKHRHRGTVTAITMSGEWGYKEYVDPKSCILQLC
jgi:2,4'-dihydroxyacetophenone dioxygenase